MPKSMLPRRRVAWRKTPAGVIGLLTAHVSERAAFDDQSVDQSDPMACSKPQTSSQTDGAFRTIPFDGAFGLDSTFAIA